jgi:hypothetical protein
MKEYAIEVWLGEANFTTTLSVDTQRTTAFIVLLHLLFLHCRYEV